MFSLLGLLLALLPRAASATHIVGGELDLQHKTGTTYTLTLNLYFDAVYGQTGAIRDVLPAGFFVKNTNQRVFDINLPLTSTTYVQYTSPACSIGSLSTRKLVYTADVQLTAANFSNAGGYYVAVENCCRNASISNIVNPGAAAQTFYLEFPAVTQNNQPFIDSTPRIFPPLSDYACRGELFYFDFGGQDTDGDSLAYDMITPLNGHATAGNPNPGQAVQAPYQPVFWNPGLNTLNQIPGTPALGINARTGRLTVQPANTGLYVFGVRCSEYRHRVKIGETRRDFQLLVVNCATNQPPHVQMQAQGSNAPYRFGRDTLRLVPGGNHCLSIRYTDPDPGSALTVTTRPVNFSGLVPSFSTTATGMVHAAGQPDTLTATLCFPACTDTHGRVYLLDVIVADNGCSLPKHDTLHVAFTAVQPPNAAPVLSSTLPPAPLPPADVSPAVVSLHLGEHYAATLHGTDADNHALTMTATGDGFDLASVGMRFTARNGAGVADGSFTWDPSCDAVRVAGYDGGGLLVHFRLTESGPCVPLPQERVVLFKVVPLPDPVAFRPSNVITPNGDGLNDFLIMPDLPLDFCDHKYAGITIYSRWGQQVFQSSERGFRWGGAGAGGMYFYLVTYTDGRRFKGWVEVIP
ncbi:MAG: gliding motility-associated C-terminal domain-containing protein [Bacteroidota bacterium]|nr:gliding motility-associated C-terminal domain-containing protein [Bacteroidota bacterium]